jgi:drug/metabolite transporter (DMT)-like permease
VLQCLLAALLFGASAPAASELAGSVSAFTLAGLLYLGAGLAVLPSVGRRPPSRVALRSEWQRAATAVVAGGAVGPVLLMAGLARTSAASASILLNMELVATAVLAAVFFHEHIGRRLAQSIVLVTFAGAVLSWRGDAGLDVGAVLIVAACVCWGLDNCVTAAIEQLSPEHVVLLKGAVAGSANLAIGLVRDGWAADTSAGDVLAALTIGALGYGWSITLWVRGARQLGAARGQVIFATAPFIGVGVAWLVLGEAVRVAQVVALVLAAVGVAWSLRSGHTHEHHHEAAEHEHEHEHDDGHHDHVHAGGFTGRHVHRHRHDERVHVHPHVPDLHHRHGH